MVRNIWIWLKSKQIYYLIYRLCTLGHFCVVWYTRMKEETKWAFLNVIPTFYLMHPSTIYFLTHSTSSSPCILPLSYSTFSMFSLHILSQIPHSTFSLFSLVAFSLYFLNSTLIYIGSNETMEWIADPSEGICRQTKEWNHDRIPIIASSIYSPSDLVSFKSWNTKWGVISYNGLRKNIVILAHCSCSQ